MDVALSFTQTKIEMPKTKQSTISTFFTPQRRGKLRPFAKKTIDVRFISLLLQLKLHLFLLSSCKVLKNISTSDEPNTPPELTSASLPVLTKRAFLGKPEMKQRRHTDQEPNVQYEWASRNLPEDVVWQEHTRNPSPLQTEEAEISEPQRKRRCTPASLLHGDTPHSLEAWSQDPLFSYSQCTDDKFDLVDNDIKGTRNLSGFELSLTDSLQSKTVFGLHLAAAERTPTQKPFKQIPSCVVDGEKENSGCSFSLSPKKHSVHSRVDRPKQQNHKDQEKNSDSQFEWTKPRTSPVKKPKLTCKTDEDDSLAMLFTQDSEGFRVIAHRSWQVRSPLKDQSNMRATRSVRSSPSKPLVLEEEEEMLFTQDSQGDLVIKH